jgi:hypothetical protein
VVTWRSTPRGLSLTSVGPRPLAGGIRPLEGRQPEAHAPPADRSAHRLKYINLSDARSERRAETTAPSETPTTQRAWRTRTSKALTFVRCAYNA